MQQYLFKAKSASQMFLCFIQPFNTTILLVLLYYCPHAFSNMHRECCLMFNGKKSGNEDMVEYQMTGSCILYSSDQVIFCEHTVLYKTTIPQLNQDRRQTLYLCTIRAKNKALSQINLYFQTKQLTTVLLVKPSMHISLSFLQHSHFSALLILYFLSTYWC